MSLRLKLIHDGDNEAEQEECESEESEEDKDPKIKELNVHGKSVIEHPDIVKYREEGYYVVSVSASLEKSAESEQKSIKFRAGFSKVGKFETEIVNETSSIIDENGRRLSTGLPLTKIRREKLSILIHEKAFEVFEECRKISIRS